MAKKTVRPNAQRNAALTPFICGVINRHGDGGHPLAVPANVEFFKAGYVRTCIARAKPNLNAVGKRLAADYLSTIS